MNEIYFVPPDQAKWLVTSSWFFLFPAIYAYFNYLYLYYSLLVFTSSISAIFWRHPTYGWRKTADQVTSKVSFTVFLATGMLNIKNETTLCLSYNVLVFMIYFFLEGDRLRREGRDYWWKYHALFHFFTMIEQFIVIKSLI